MTDLTQLPPAVALLVAALVTVGTVLTLLGAIGLVQLGNFYERLHTPTLGTSWGAAGILLGSMIMFSVMGTRPVVHEIFLGLLIMVTTPVTLMVFGRAALHRDRAEGRAPPGTEGYRPLARSPEAAAGEGRGVEPDR